MMEHVAKDGALKILRACSLLPTGTRVVNRMISDLCIMDVTASGLVVKSLAPDVTPQRFEPATEPALRFVL